MKNKKNFSRIADNLGIEKETRLAKSKIKESRGRNLNNLHI